jgi:PBSX family phage terminase large subunit
MLDELQEIAALLKYDPAYEWRGGNKALIDSTTPEVIAAGPSETGKTFAACYKSHMACREYPGAQGALVRKVAASIPGTVLVTMKRVVGDFPVNYFGGQNNPERIIYPNGSQIWIGGMDNPTKVLSGERDFIQVCQAEELSINDWEIMTTRTTGRGAVMPYTQVFGDCNPASPKHWIKTRQSINVLATTHRDNPSLFDKDGNITEQGRRSLETLEKLTGTRRKRLLEGLWSTAQDAVFENIEVREITDKEIAEFEYIYMGVDWGYFPDPFAWVKMSYDAARRVLYIFDEYRVNRASNQQTYDHLVQYKKVRPYDEIIADSAEPKSIADYRAFGLTCRATTKGSDSINYSFKWLQGISRIIIDDKRAPETAQEFLDYEFERDKNGEIIDRYPDHNNHSIDAVRYGMNRVWIRRGE